MKKQSGDIDEKYVVHVRFQSNIFFFNEEHLDISFNLPSEYLSLWSNILALELS